MKYKMEDIKELIDSVDDDLSHEVASIKAIAMIHYNKMYDANLGDGEK